MTSDPESSIRSVTRTLADLVEVLGAPDDADSRLSAALALVGQLVPNSCCALLHSLPTTICRSLVTWPDLEPPKRAPLAARLEVLLRRLDGSARPDDPPTSAPGATARATVPVLGMNEPIGVLFVERDAEPYDETHLRLLSVIAAHLGSWLTMLRLREEELAHAKELGLAIHRLEETDRRKDEFLAMLGHELRNPLGAISNALRIIDHPAAKDPTRFHRLIDRQLRHLSRIVDDLLDASRIRLGKIVLERQPVDLVQIVERWMEVSWKLADKRTHDVALVRSPDPVPVEGDPVRLEQVFSNLMTNALRYTPAGGRIEVGVGRDGASGVIRVRDTGIGMSGETLETIFDLFTQADTSLVRSSGGLGLGLPLARSLVERHGGTLTATSGGPGLGSEFVVRLPLSLAPSEPAEPASTEPDPRPLRILVIEDNVDARMTLREILELWNHRVEEAGDGELGLARALAGGYDVVLCDIGLPTLDGYAVARGIRRAMGDRTPLLLAMTGYGQPEDRRRSREAGFDDHFVKPVTPQALSRRLAAIPR